MGLGGRWWWGGPGWATHVNPWLIHVNVWQKPLQYCKVISLQLIKINEKKKKSKLITLPAKVHIVKAMVFPVVTYRCESWTIKKAECQRIDAFELWCWRRLLDCKKIKPVNSKGNQPCVFIGKAVVETLTLWPLDAKS